ncbi:RES family NAD+ phosphorylase [Streptomyces kunmingensis]|uniref:RES family NAD+ phosphorylase n=1 Tax=Streptomyces kunmingensis TaxID=68225 RepID=A0ABU6C7X9_9ACTN|nr:RES family NAD+ phosphorylase [Streptomyces kunmingensis]MEB3960821.1 RES family NAD+ phosphorylase [Streptomyces kunmingensis]
MTSSPAADVRLIPAPAEGVWRLGKTPDPLSYDTLAPADEQSTAGNAWSASTYGTLYCASQQDGCFAEALAPFRVHPDMRELVDGDWHEPYFVGPGKMVRDWSAKHTLLRLEPAKESRFLDVDDDTTLKALTALLEPRLEELGVTLPELTREHTQGFHRRLTRAIARWAHAQRTSQGTPSIHGIAYKSRFGMRQCWAVFDNTTVERLESTYVFPESVPLRTVAHEYGLQMF